MTSPHPSAKRREDETHSLPFVAYELEHDTGFTLVPAAMQRTWMAATASRFANRCLPLVMANQSGWLLLNNQAFRCRWIDDGFDGVQIEYSGAAPTYRAVSHFGAGIVTWNLPLLFRTPPGFDLLARGPANWVKDGVTPLEELIETDSTAATFTMNWKLTRRGNWVSFDRDEPLCMLVPQRRGDLERFEPEIRPITADPHLQQVHAQWASSRAEFLRELNEPGSAAQQSGWQKDYMLGRTDTGGRSDARRTRIALRSFTAGQRGPLTDAEPGTCAIVAGHHARSEERWKVATGRDLVIRENFVPPTYCRRLIAAYEDGLASGRLHPRGIQVRDLPLSVVTANDRELRQWTRRVCSSVGDLLAEEFDLPGLFADYSAFKCEHEGGAHSRHADNVTATGEPNHTYWREATAMIYLNNGEHDFAGGRIRFARLGREIVAKSGLLVGFGCGIDFEHEVSPVRRGRRYGMGLWFTRDANRRETW
jgi:hypothetical protein